MSRFVTKTLQTIDLGDDEWVKIPKALSYNDVIKLTSFESDSEKSKALLSECIKEWNIKDEEGNIPELKLENIMRLDISTIDTISNELVKLLENNQDKKK